MRFVIRDFPINRSGISRKVAEAAVCADEQGKFWALHDRAFANQDALTAITPAMLAESVGLDMTRFNACFDNPATRQAVQGSFEEARRLGVSGTPTFFVNGRKIEAHGEIEQELSEAIDRALEESAP